MQTCRVEPTSDPEAREDPDGGLPARDGIDMSRAFQPASRHTRCGRGTKARRRRPLHDALPRLFLLLGLLLPALPAATAQPDQDTALRDELLDADSPGKWTGLLKRIILEKDRSWITRVIGEMFLDREAYAAHGALVARAGAFFADYPLEDGAPVLLPQVIRRAHGDDAFVVGVREWLEGPEGWNRLLDEARRMLASDDVNSRSIGVWFLSRQDGPAEDVTPVLWEIWSRAKEDLPLLQQANGGAEALAKAYLDAFQVVLGFRFPSVDTAVTELEKQKGRHLHEIIRALSKLRDTERSPERELLLRLGMQVVDSAVAGGQPEKLGVFLDPRKVDVPELRLYAVQQAAKMNPQPNEVWARLLCTPFTWEDDLRVFRGLLDLIEQMTFTTDPAALVAADSLGDCVVKRLEVRDPVADRVRLASILGRIKIRQKAIEALTNIVGENEVLVRAALIRALGAVENASAEDVLTPYRDHAGDDEAKVLVRVAVAEALGGPGMVAHAGPAAAAALREILDGQGDAGLGRDGDARVRLQAIRSLRNHPGEETSRVLGAIALATDDQEADAAFLVLGAHVLRTKQDEHGPAVLALAAVVRERQAPMERRRRALKELAALDVEVAAAVRTHVMEAAREVLGATEDPLDLRLQAADTAAALADGLALAPLVAFWREEPGEHRAAKLEALLVAVAAAGGAHDEGIADTLLAVAATGRWDWSIERAGTLVESYPRVGVQVAWARLLHARGGVEERSLDERRADLEAAHGRLDAVLAAAAPEEAEKARRLHVLVLRDLGALYAPDDPASLEKRKEAFLEAVRIASESTDPQTAQLALPLIDDLNGRELTPAETASLNAARQKIEDLLGQ
jgi:hypothetical protein